MPIYEIKGPDGKIYSIEGPDGATRAEVIAAIERRKGGGASGAKPESGFFNSIAEGAKTIFSGDEAAKFAAASPEERDSLRRKFLASTAGDTQGIGLSDVDNIPEFWQWLKQTAGQSLGAMAAPAAVGFASKLAGAPNPMARAVGYTAMGVQYVIDNLARQAQEQDAAISEGREVPETDVGKAIIGASAQTGLDVGVMELAFKPLLTRFPVVKALFEGGELTTKRNVAQLAQALKNGELKVSNGLVKGMLFGAAVEAPQELVQTLIERWQAGLPLADAEAKKEYFEAAVGGGILGAGFGAGQKAMVNQGEIGLARDELARQDAELQAQEAERAKAIEEQEKAAKEAELAEKAKFSTPATPSAAPGVGVPRPAPGVGVPRPAPGATTGAPKPKAMGADAYNALVDNATQFINDYTAKNGAVETTPNEWYNALEKGFNLRPGEASRLLGDLKRRKVLNFRASDEGLNSLYTPTIIEKRQKLLSDLDPEIRRVKGVATPEHITAIDKILATLGPSSVDEKGKPVYKRLQQTKVDALTTELNTLLGLYGTGAPAGTGTPPPPADTTGASVPPPDAAAAAADAAAKAQADADAAAKAQADADADAAAAGQGQGAPIASDITFGEPDENGVRYLHAAMKRDGKSYVFDRGGPSVEFDAPASIGALSVNSASLSDQGTQLNFGASSSKESDIKVRMKLDGKRPGVIEFYFGATGFVRYEKGKPENADKARAALGDDIFDLFNSSDDPAVFQQIFTRVAGEDAPSHVEELMNAFNKHYDMRNADGTPIVTSTPPPPPPPPPAAAGKLSTEEQRAQVIAKFKEAGKANVALVRAILGGAQSDAKAYFQQLIDAGIVVQVGNSTRYKLAEESKPPTGESGVNEDEDEDSDQPPVDPNDIPPQREEDEDFLDYTERFNKWKLNRSPEQAARIEQAQRKNASRDSNKLNKDKEFATPDQGITYKFVDGGYGVEAYNDKKQLIGSITTKDGFNVGNIEVAPEFRRKRIAEKMFDRLRRIHGTVGFKDSPLNEEGAKFAAHLYSTRKPTDNGVEVPGYVREAGDRAILKRKAQQVYKEVLKYALANNGVIPPFNVLEKQFNMNREEVSYGYVALANDGYIEPATQTETIGGKKFTRQLNYYVATEKLKDAVAAEQAKQLGNDKPKEITLVPEEEKVSADVEEADFREGLLSYLEDKPRTDEDIKNEYEENLALASKVLADLVAKGEVIYEKGTYRLKSVEKPAEKPKTTGEAVIVMMKASTVRKLFKQLIDAGVPGFTPESLKETMEQVLSDTSLLDSKIAKLENDLEAYNAGVSDFRTKEETQSHTNVTDKTRAAELKLAGKPVDNFIDYVLRHGTMYQKVFAKRIQLRINEMRANGVNFTMQHAADISDYKRIYGSSPAFGMIAGQVKYNFYHQENYASATFEIAFTGNELGFTGYNTETILHELIHATTIYGYEIGRLYKSAATRPVWHKASLDIIKLHGHVGREALKLRDEGKLTPEEKYLVDETNFLKNPHEIMAWGQADDTTKRLLERIQYGTNERGGPRTAWDAFVSIMRRLLGLSAEADTALSELLHLTSAFLVEDTSAFASGASPSMTLSGSVQSAMNTNPNVYVAKPIHVGGFDDTTKRLAQQEAVRIDARKGVRETLGNLFSQNKWERIVTNFQNERRPLKRLSDLLDAAGLLDVFDRVNDLFGEITRSMAMSENILNETMWRHMVDVDKQVLELSEATGKTKDVVLAELQQYTMGRHESERRKAFYEMFVPLNNRVNTMLDAKLLKNIMVIPRDENGKPMRKATAIPLASISAPPARLRQIIMTELNQNQDLVSNGYAESMRSALSELIERNNKQNVDGTVDGFSPMLGKKGLRLNTDINDRVYDVIGAYSRNQINEMEARYKAALADPKAGPILKRMLDPNTGSIAMLQKATIAADKSSNYWSNPVDNRKAFYGWKYYVPLKGSVDTAANKTALDELNFQGDRLGGGFNDVQGEMGGRENDSENPILRTLVDATKSAIRYGRKGTMEAIGNLIDKDPRTDKQYLKGKKVGNIPFDQRMNMIGDKKFSGPDKFFVYRANGSIDVYEVSDKQMKEAIRRTFSAPNKLVDMANAVTSGIGHLHTRYNVAFHPYNFVRDALTNAFTLGAEFGPAMSATLLKAVATRVSQSGMLTKAAKISALYRDGKVAEIERMAKAGDVFASDALRYFKRGGRVTRLSGTDIREQGERMMKDLRRGDVARSKEVLDTFVDNWADSFELTSRLATFGVLRNYYTSKGMSEQEAEIRATTYAKNLANFEQVGRYGRVAGALFMFFRPAATGAVRAIDALTPAFQSWESYKKNIPEDILGEPNGAAYKKIEKDFLARKKSAQGMMMALAGAGAMLWTMAWMMSDDDEIGRNRTATDKMSLWTRNARMPLSFLGEKYKDSYFQIPWGFGVGAFGAIGAQVAGVAGGYTTLGEAIPNLITIGLDSYMPVPVSRIDPTENFSAFAASSFFPSAARPLLEYAMNVDGLGREIYNDRQTRYGDAFTGGRNTPQLWKDTARMLFNTTGGEWDVDPDTLLFFANNYLDGFTRIAQSGYGLSLSMSGEKNFSVKEDFAPLSSFVGRASNYDGEKYANLEQNMRELNQRIRSLERDRELYREYIQGNYNEYQAVQMFNRDSNGWLRKLRQMRNQIEASDLSAVEKEERLRGVYLATGYVKRGLLARAKDAGISL